MQNKKAETIATILFEKVSCPYTTPKTIITYNDPKFNNDILGEICSIFNTKKINVHSYIPESNWVVERLNRKLITCLRTLISQHSITWHTWIPQVTFALNTQINSATGETPHYILFGEDKNLPYSLICGATVSHTAHNREVPGSIPGRNGKIWAVFPRPLRPCSPSSEQVRDVRQGVVTSLSRKVNCSNPVVTLALCPGLMGSFPPQAQGHMSRRWAPRTSAASAYAPNFTFTFTSRVRTASSL